MSSWPQLCIVGSGFISLTLGSLHLLYTFRGNKLFPRNAELINSMRGTSMHITRETDMWSAWIGFNASHSLGAMGLGSVLIATALQAEEMLSTTWTWPLGLAAWMAAYLMLAHRYWFSIPQRGLTTAFALLLIGLVGLRMKGQKP